MLAEWPAPLTSAFNRLGQYASSLDNRAYCYAELAIFFPSNDRTITTHFAYPQRDGQAELTWVVD